MNTINIQKGRPKPFFCCLLHFASLFGTGVIEGCFNTSELADKHHIETSIHLVAGCIAQELSVIKLILILILQCKRLIVLPRIE